MKSLLIVFGLTTAAASLALPNAIASQSIPNNNSKAVGKTNTKVETVKPLDSAINPFDFTHWKLTLPVDANNSYDGRPLEIPAKQLTAGFNNQYFSTKSDGQLVFWSPVIGVRTDNTDYARCELREMLEPGNPRKNWVADGNHVLAARCRVLQVPSNPKVVIGQIHSESGKRKPLIKLQFFKGRIEALVKSSPTKGKDIKLTWPNVERDSDIDYEIRVQGPVLSVTVNQVTQSQNIKDNDPEWMNQTFYFKAGVYPQDNQGDETEGGRVSFSKLNVSHQHRED